MRPFRRRLVLEAPARLPDGSGGHATQWTALGTLWADLRPLSTAERTVPAGATATARARIACRAAPPGAPSRPRPGQRLRAGDGRAWRILSVAEGDALGRTLTLEAEEEARP